MRNSGRYVRTGTSRSTLPSSTSCMTSVLVQSLVIEPIWNTESGVASTPVALLRMPAASSTTSPSARTATAAPGTWYLSISAGSCSATHVFTSLRVLMIATLGNDPDRRVGRTRQGLWLRLSGWTRVCHVRVTPGAAAAWGTHGERVRPVAVRLAVLGGSELFPRRAGAEYNETPLFLGHGGRGRRKGPTDAPQFSGRRDRRCLRDALPRRSTRTVRLVGLSGRLTTSGSTRRGRRRVPGRGLPLPRQGRPRRPGRADREAAVRCRRPRRHRPLEQARYAGRADGHRRAPRHRAARRPGGRRARLPRRVPRRPGPHRPGRRVGRGAGQPRRWARTPTWWSCASSSATCQPASTASPPWACATARCSTSARRWRATRRHRPGHPDGGRRRAARRPRRRHRRARRAGDDRGRRARAGRRRPAPPSRWCSAPRTTRPPASPATSTPVPARCWSART